MGFVDSIILPGGPPDAGGNSKMVDLFSDMSQRFWPYVRKVVTHGCSSRRRGVLWWPESCWTCVRISGLAALSMDTGIGFWMGNVDWTWMVWDHRWGHYLAMAALVWVSLAYPFEQKGHQEDEGVEPGPGGLPTTWGLEVDKDQKGEKES